MDNIKEGEQFYSKGELSVLEKPSEKRRGVSPFTDKPERESNKKIATIKSRPIPFGDLGNLRIVLTRPQKETISENINKNDQYFTMDLDGKIKKVAPSDFQNKDYYNLDVIIELDAQQSPVKTGQKMIAEVWINDEESVVTAPLARGYNKYDAPFIRGFESGGTESLVFLNDPELLKALKVNVVSQ